MEDKKYYLTVNGENVEVSEEVHYVYRSETEKIKYQNRKQKDVVVSYNCTVNVDGDDIDGEETLQDYNNLPLDKDIFNGISKIELLLALEQLTPEEMQLIKSIFFYNYTDRGYSNISGIKQTTVSYRRKKILKKLRNLLENS